MIEKENGRIPVAAETNELTQPREVFQRLRDLSDRVANVIAEGVAEGLLKPNEDTYARDRIDAVDETEHGISRIAWDTEYITKKSWRDAARIASWRVKELDEYTASLTSLNESTLKEDDAKRLLEAFTHQLAYGVLETADPTAKTKLVKDLIDVVGKHLKKEPFVHTSKVRLVGVTAPKNGAKFTVAETDFLLRRVTVADLANEEMYFGRREYFPNDPSAILKIKMNAYWGNEVQKKVSQSITLLRLFKPGPVSYLSHEDDSESLLGFGRHKITSGKQWSGFGRCIIGDEEVDKLINFWRSLAEVLPQEGYERKATRVEPIEIAYQQYSDSLLTGGATVERRISDAVMGLESLYLTRHENQELIYRLRMRIAKFLGTLGKDPYSARNITSDAYCVRSAFVHGASVKEDDRRRIERRYESFERLLEAALEQLRVAIVAFTMIGQTKEEMIKLIDYSFIDSRKEPDLENVIAPLRHLFS